MSVNAKLNILTVAALTAAAFLLFDVATLILR